MYAKLNNGVINYAPKNFMTDNGQLITNFNKSKTLMERYGFKEVLDVRPVFDSEKQYLNIAGYKENDVNIIIEYNVLDKEEPAPSLEERVTALENEIGNMSTMLIQTLELNNDDLM